MLVFIRTLIFISLFSCSLSFASQKLIFCYELADYPPYINSLDPADNTTGYLNELISQTGNSLGIDIVFKRDSWGRCKKKVLDGSYHGLFAMIATPERSAQFAFPQDALSAPSRYLWQVNYPIFYPKSKGLNLSSYPNQFSTGLGAPFGYVVHQILANKKLLTPHNYTAEEGLKLVAQGKLDGYVVESEIGKLILEKLGEIDRVDISEEIILTSYWFLPFSRQFYQENPELVELFWTTLNKNRLAYRPVSRADSGSSSPTSTN
ncbi:transporter substrate-binding domain-containing protein [Paraglaciecola sp. 25GB23A]|uniref:transporter substrate-binding domain-containing protein n=1 Tax=Paraglaciecola sp. 25GB23A TaxID=3156068 RepID=UPI0032AF02AF